MEIKVKLDRVTINSQIIKHKTSLEELKNYLENSDWEYVSDNEFRLTRKFEDGQYEHIAGLYRNPFQHESWRMDTSNHLESQKELDEILKVTRFMSKPKLSRIDIAFDFINGNLPEMAHDIYRFNNSKTKYTSEELSDLKSTMKIKNRGQKVQTIYSGKRGSKARLIRYYSKIDEQKARRKKIPEHIKKWERLEIQLNSEKNTTNWEKETKDMLDCFRMPVLNTLKARDRAMLFALTSDVVSWSELSRDVKRHYKDLIADVNAFDDSYAKQAYKVLIENKDSIQAEIDTFMNRLEYQKDDQTD